MLTPEERVQYMEDVNHVAEILHELFHPDKINFGAYGDTMHHLHFHLVPKYKDGFEWGGVFAMNPHEVTLSPEAYDELIGMIRARL
jgi:diadenosine tetraphosphate (Ap4A) HIT family hydrolase